MSAMDAEKTEKLISVVSQHTELYDMTNKNYTDQNRREKLWADIGLYIGESGEVCKQRWRTLRDAFQRAARSRRTKSGQAAAVTKKWKYWDAMHFLLPHVKGRETHSNVETYENEEIDQVNFEESITQVGDDENRDVNSDVASNISAQSSEIATPLTSRRDSKKRKFDENLKQSESLPEMLKDYIEHKKRRSNQRQEIAIDKNMNSTGILDFFVAMGKTVSTFPPLLQATIKNKVFEIVSSAELQVLESPTAQPPTSVNATLEDSYQTTISRHASVQEDMYYYNM